MISKVIHYTWFGGNPLPQDVKQCIASWKKYCPDYEIRQWDESNFDVTAHPFIKAAYEAKAWAFVSDYARLKIVYDHGGIYLDTDVELVKSLDEVLHHSAYFGVQQVGNYVATGLGFGAQQQHPAVLKMLQQYDAVTFAPEKKEELACPYLNTRALESVGFAPQEAVQLLCDGTVAVYPPRFFDPVAPGDSEDLRCEDTVSIHCYSASWASEATQFKRRLIRRIGVSRMQKLKELIAKLKSVGKGNKR